MTSEELETEAECVEVRVLWDESVLHVAHFTPPRSFHIGDGRDCDYVVPSELLDGKERVALALGATERLTLEGGLTFEVSSVKAGRVVAGRTALQSRPMAMVLFSALLHGAVLAAMLFFKPQANVDPGELRVDTFDRLQKVIAAQDAFDEAEREEWELEESLSWPTLARFKPGYRGAPRPRPRYGTSRRGIDTRDPKTRRRETFHDAHDFGSMALLQVPDLGIPGPSWRGPDEAPGHWIHPIEEFLVEAGLGPAEFPAAGGEHGRAPLFASIAGLERRIASSSTGQGFGGTHPLGGSHRSKPPSIRRGEVSVSGRIVPEVIYRVVRTRFPRFRECYERGLRNNPNLQGTVRVSFTIDVTGGVGYFGGGGSMPDSSVVSCVTKAFEELSFPAPDKGIAKVVYPVQFSPGS